MTKILLSILALTFGSQIAFAGALVQLGISKISLNVPGAQAEDVLDATTTNLISVFENYIPGTDRTSTVVGQPVIGGTSTNPTYQAIIKKRVFGFPVSVKLAALANSTKLPPTDKCSAMYRVDVDLTNSASQVSDSYSKLVVQMCAIIAEARTDVVLKVSVEQTPTFSTGMEQGVALEMLRLQPAALTKAVNQALIEASRN